MSRAGEVSQLHSYVSNKVNKRHKAAENVVANMSSASEVLHLHKAAGKVLPKIVILDLDYTIWDSMCARKTVPPYKLTGMHEVTDDNGSGWQIRIGEHTRDILTALRQHGCRLGIASLNGDFHKSTQLLKAFGIWHYFEEEPELVQILRGRNKSQHLKNIKLAAGESVAWNEMLLFDDAPDNVQLARLYDSTAVLVTQRCLTMQVLRDALQAHSSR